MKVTLTSIRERRSDPNVHTLCVDALAPADRDLLRALLVTQRRVTIYIRTTKDTSR